MHSIGLCDQCHRNPGDKAAKLKKKKNSFRGYDKNRKSTDEKKKKRETWTREASASSEID